MNIPRLCLVALPLALLWACSGGGGSTTSAQVQWEKFRHDTGNSGAAVGAVATINITPRSTPVDAPTPPATPGAISSSPAIAEDGTVYVGSEGGTLAAFDANLNLKWRKTSCEACPADSQALGPLISSPAVYTLNGQTSILIGSSASSASTGSVFAFQDTGSGQPPTCTACFRPNPADFGGSDVSILASFVSSPSFTTDPVIFTINGIFIGAHIDVRQAGNTRTLGRLYALNSDGSVRWEFPRQNAPDIGPVTSSPALGISNTWWFTAADGFLYVLTSDGSLKGSVFVGSTFGPTAPFAPAVLVTGNYIVSPTGDGDIFAITPDQSVSFRIGSVDSGVTASLAFGSRGEVTPTPTAVPAMSPTAPSGPTPTATATPTAGIPSFVYGVTQSGEVVGFDPAQPTPTLFPTPPTPIPVPVLSSPALSSDGFLVFGSSDGKLHAVSTVDGSEATGFPVQLTTGAIRSSPSIATDGTIYVGADDGMVYAVGLP
jgi:outer membrane protein assembly factor BamB